MKLFLFIYIHLYTLIASTYIFSSTKELISQLTSASIDELIYILSKLENYTFTTYEMTKDRSKYIKYAQDRAQLLSAITQLMDQGSITSSILSQQILQEHLKRSASDEIKSSDWYQKVSWVINADLYYLRMEMRQPQIGGIIDYVNYLTTDQLDKYLYELLERIPSFEDDYASFEKEIMNRQPIPSDLIKYLEVQNITLLNEWSARIQMYLKPKGKDNCKEIAEILSTTNQQQAFLYVNKFVSHFDNYDSFYKIIVYNQHSMPLLKQELSLMSLVEIQQVSKYVESYHRRATKNTKSFINLFEYVNQIPQEYLIEYIVNESKMYPELNEKSRANDFHQIQNIASLSNVNSKLIRKKRDEIIRWALTIPDHFDDSSQSSSLGFENEYIYSQTSERILEDMFTYLKSKTGDYSIDEVSQLGEPQSDMENYRFLVLSRYPPVIQLKWLVKLQEYHQHESNAPASPIDFQNPSELYFNLNKYIILYAIDREAFRKIVDDSSDDYVISYGNYASYFYSINNTELEVWLRQVEEYIRDKKHYYNIIGGLKYANISNSIFNKADERELHKSMVIYKLLTYIELNSELKDITAFDKVIGLYHFHMKFHTATIESLKQYVIALRKYHDIKLIKVKTSESSETALNDFIHNADECHLKLYIFRILALLPELNIPSVWSTVIELGNDGLPETYTQTVFMSYLNTLSQEKLIHYCKQCSRFSNALKYVYMQDDCATKDRTALIWNAISTVFTNEILRYNINFLRLNWGSEEMIYGSLEPFINRQPNDNLDIMIAKLPQRFFFGEEFNREGLLKETREKKIEVIMNLIYKNKLSSLKQFDDYLDASKGNKELFVLSKWQLGIYALVTENHLRIKLKGEGEESIDNYDIVSDKYLQMTKNELIRYILRANLPISDLEIKSKMVLLAIGDINYSKFN